MFSRYVMGFIVAAIGSGAISAEAETVQVTYTGTITISQDLDGIFGAPAASLSGDFVKVVYLFNTSANGFTLSSATQNYVYGGTLFGNDSPALGATVEVNHHVAQIGGSQYGIINGTNNSAYSFQSHESDGSDTSYVYSSVTAAPGALPASITTPFSYPVVSGDNAVGYFEISSQTFGGFVPATVAVSVVPEPSTWAMTILGFAGFAVMAARRKSNAAAARLA
jgi:hypothetical protein